MSDELKRYAELLKSPDPEARKKGILGLLEIETNASYELLKTTIGDPDIHVRYFARDSIRRLQARLLETLRSADEAAQVDIIKMLGNEKDADACDFLMDYFDIAPLKAQIFIAQSLGQIGEKKALPFLVERLRSGKLHDFVISTVVKAVGRLGSIDEIPLLAEKLNAEDSRLRANTIEALEYIGDRRIIDLVEPMLNDPDPRVKTYAARALLQFGDRKMLEKFETLLNSDDSLIRENAIWALGESGNISAIKLLKGLLTKKQDQAGVLRALGKIVLNSPNDDLLGILVRYMGHYSKDLREIAEEYLGKLEARLFDDSTPWEEREFLAALLIRKYSSSDLLDIAVKVLRKWRDIKGIGPELQINLVELLIQQKKWLKAVEECKALGDLSKAHSHTATKLLEKMIASGCKEPEVFGVLSDFFQKMEEEEKAWNISLKLVNIFVEDSVEFLIYAKPYLMKKVLNYSGKMGLSKNDIKHKYMYTAYKMAIDDIGAYKSQDSREKALRLRDIWQGRFTSAGFGSISPERMPSTIDALLNLFSKIKKSKNDKFKKKIMTVIQPFWRSITYERRLTKEPNNGWMDLFAQTVEEGQLLAPENPEAPILPLLGKLYADNQNYGEAIRMFEAILANEPEKVEIHKILYDLFKKSGNRKEMLFELKIMAHLSELSGSFSEAKEMYKNLCKEAPEEAEYLNNLMRMMEKVLTENPKDFQTRVEYAGYLERKNKFRSAFEQYKAILDEDREYSEALNGLEYLKKKSLENMDKELEESILEYMLKMGIIHDIDPYINLVKLAVDTNKIEEYRALYSQRGKEKYETFDIRMMATINAVSTNYINALKDADLLEKSPENIRWTEELIKRSLITAKEKKRSELLLYLMNRENKDGNLTGAIEYGEVLTKEFPDDQSVRENIADLYEKAGLMVKASEIYEVIVRENPLSKEIIEKYAGLLQNYDLVKASQEYLKLLRMEPDSKKRSDDIMKISVKALRAGNIDLAAKSWESLLQISPNSPLKEEAEQYLASDSEFRGLFDRVKKLIQATELERAVEFLAEAAAQEMMQPLVQGLLSNILRIGGAPLGYAHFVLAESLSRSGDFQDAISHYDDAIKNDPQLLIMAQKGASYCYLKLELFDKAYERILRVDRDHRQIDDYIKGLSYEIGMGLISAGKVGKAFTVLKELFSMDPNFRDVGEKIRYLEKEISKVRGS